MLKREGKLRFKEIAEAYIPPDMVGFLQGIMEEAYLNRTPKKYREMIKKTGDHDA